MTSTAVDTRYMAARHIKELLRQPMLVVANLVQPLIWLLLFGALFEAVTQIPGFASDDYVGFLAPGVVMMTAFFSSAWSGMALLEDLDRGVTNRFLVSPVSRYALVMGRLAQGAAATVIQTAIIVALALALGAQFAGGIGGLAVLLVIAILTGAAFGALSNGLALVVRREEALIAAMQFLMLPLSFLSVAFMQKDLMPDWMQTVASLNPLNWAVEAGREALSSSPDWGLIGTRAGLVAVFVAAMLLLAVRAFDGYQRSL